MESDGEEDNEYNERWPSDDEYEFRSDEDDDDVDDDDASSGAAWTYRRPLEEVDSTSDDDDREASALETIADERFAALFDAQELQGDVRKLFEACRDGDARSIRRLVRPRWKLGRGIDVNTSVAGKTPLMLAAGKDQVEVVMYLLGEGANVNAVDLDGKTALHFAWSEEMMTLLVSNGATLETWKEKLLLAAACGDISTAMALLSAERRYRASCKANLLKIQTYAVDTPVGDDGATVLMVACENNQYNMVEFLLNHSGANVSVTDARGRTPLHAARDERTVKLLLSHGADVNAVDKNGRTRLHFVFEGVDEDNKFVRYLLHSGAKVDIADNTGNHILHVAITTLLAADQRLSRKFSLAVQVIQDLIQLDAKWDDRCDAIVDATAGFADSSLRRRLGSALRFAMLLWVDERSLGLPFTPIPREDLERGLGATKTYVREHQASTSIVCRRTVCLVGPSTAGKTSLIKSLVKETVWLESIDVRTMGIDHIKFEFEDRVRAAVPRSHAITFSDFAGQDAYQVMHSLFFTRRTLFLVCVDLEAYGLAMLKCEMLTYTDKQFQHMMNEYVDRHVLEWIRLIFARQPDADFVFVCTKEDAISSGPCVDKTEVVSHVRKMLGRVMVIVQHMRRDYETSQSEDASKVVAAHRVTHLWDPSLANGTTPEVKVIMSSSTTTASVLHTRREIMDLIADCSRSYEMPEKYTLVLNALTMRKLAAAIKSRVRRIENLFLEVTELVHKLQRSVRDLDDVTALEILRSLRDRGDILWYEDMKDEKLKRTVMLDPRLLIDFLREITNHKHVKGTLSHELIACLPCWRDLNDDNDTMLAMKLLLQTFHLVHPTSGEMAYDSDLIVPAYWKTNRHSVWVFGGEDLRLRPRGSENEAVSYRILWEFRFAHYIPHTLFQNLAVAAYAPNIPLEVGPDYILYRNADRAACRIILSRDRKTQLRSLRLESVVADDPSVVAKPAKAMWFVFKRLCKALAAVLKEHKGLVVTSYAHTTEKGYPPKLRSLFKSKETMIEEDELGVEWMPPGETAYECLKVLVGS